MRRPRGLTAISDNPMQERKLLEGGLTRTRYTAVVGLFGDLSASPVIA